MQRLWSRPGLWAIVGSHLLADFYVGAVAATLPYFVTEAHYSYAQVAGLAFAMTAVASVAQPGFGVLADRFRLRWAVPGCIAATGACMSLSATAADHYGLVWILIAAAGAASAGYHPPATIVVRELSPGSNTPVSVFAAAGNLGVALGPVAVVAVVGGGGLDATPLLMVPAVIGLALYFWAARGDDVLRQRVRRPAPVTPRRDPPTDPALLRPAAAGTTAAAPAATTATTVTGRPEDGSGPDRWGMFGRLLIPMTGWQVAFTATAAFVGIFVIDEFGAGMGAASLPLVLLPAAGAAGTLLGGWLADRVGRLLVIRTGYAVALVATVAIAAAPATWVVVVATGLLGAGVFMPFAPQLTLAYTYLPRRVGTASGLSIGLTATLGGLVTAGLGHVADVTGPRAVFAVVAVFLALGVAFAFTLRDPEARRRSRPDRPDRSGVLAGVEAER
jgi:FSR family fosmidomycin resistance protein-like MFS transporter